MFNKMVDYFEMLGTWEERNVARYEDEKVVVDTSAVTDCIEPFETGIQHPAYNNGDWVIVEAYDTVKQAQKGHEKWVKLLTSNKPPRDIEDIRTLEVHLYSQ